MKSKQSKQSKELDTGVYELNTNANTKKQEKKSKNSNKLIYTLYGSHHKLKDGYPSLLNVETDNKLAYAVAETKNDVTTYYIKIDNYNNLFNPIDLAPSHAKSLEKVNEKCFNSYKEFLKTRNILYFKFAEQARL